MRAEVLQEIAAMLDHPNVYMGGPSQRNMRRAEQIYAAVAPIIAKQERERCARVAHQHGYDLANLDERNGAFSAAAAIRELGDKV